MKTTAHLLAFALSLVLGPAAQAADWSAAGILVEGRNAHTATLLPSGKVLAAGGYNGYYLVSAELYDPATNAWSAVGSLATARTFHTATLLPSGKVLAAGGEGNGSVRLASAELYDPATNAWSAAGSLATARYRHTATLLPSGMVLVAGGVSNIGVLGSAELYDPATNAWSAAGSLATVRYGHTATLLPGGQVLVVGGYNNSAVLASAELYDPATNTWSTAGSLATARGYYTATLLPSGQLLLAGGYDYSGRLASAELYDPATDSWSAAGSLATARYVHTATLLPGAKVLVAGGEGNFPFGYHAAGAELYYTGPPPVVDPVTTVLGRKGARVPGSHTPGSGIPTAVWVSFGVPSINDARQCAMLATFTTGNAITTAILGWDLADMAGTVRVIARRGGAAPGIANAVMSGLKEPLLGPDGAIAWIATLANAPGTTSAVTSVDNTAIFLDADGTGAGAAVLVARKGSVATGAVAATVIPPGVDPLPEWGVFTSVALGADAVAFTATMAKTTPGITGSPGPGGVTALTDSGLWMYERGSSTLALALREGDSLLGSTVKDIAALLARPGSPGQGDGVGNDGSADFTSVRVILGDNRQVAGKIAHNGTLAIACVAGGDAPDYGAGAKWQSFGVPTQNTAAAMAFAGTVKAGTGTATSMNNVAIFAEDDEDNLPARIVSKGDATGVSGGIFSALKDPVNAGNRSVAFLGTMKADAINGINSTNNDGIWRSDDTNGLSLVAREGAQPPEAPVGAQWKSFTSLALPEGARGPLFVGTMHSKTAGVSPGPGNITAATDVGLWATDSTGALRLLLQEGEDIGASKVKTFIVLSSVTGSPAQKRSFNSGGSVLVKVTDLLGAQHLLHIAVP